MKLKNLIMTIPLLAALTINTACEDMLTVDTGDKAYTNANDTLYSYLGILKCVQDVAERQVILNELRGDLVSTTEYVTDTLHAIANFDDPQDGSCSMLQISDYYAIINNCNLYIANADTSAVKSNKQYMMPEYAQVQAIRAWTYMQLVNLYGSVPFISEPIASLDVLDRFDYDNNQVTSENLLDRLLDLGLDKYIDTDYPVYGTYNNGAITYASSLAFFPVRLVLADLYLQRGASQADYRQAAQYYYDYLRTLSQPLPASAATATKLNGNAATVFGTDYTFSRSGNWGRAAAQYTTSTANDLITSIPSSANKQFGTMLLRVADIYGYTPTSSQSSETTTDDDGEEETTTSGAISVIPTYKSQTISSPAYQALNQAQTYVVWTQGSNNRREDYACGDARFNCATSELTFNTGGSTSTTVRLASKAASGNTFYYSIPVYRKGVVWLRLAEALNRAGFPQHAFAILKDGISAYNYPDTAATITTYPVSLDENGDTIFNEYGYAKRDTVVTQYTAYNTYGAMHYVSKDEIKDFFLSFKDDNWDYNYGIHARGCGYGRWSVSEGQVTNITGYNDSTVFDYVPRLQAEGIDPTTASENDIINAVENIIADELALEAAFEGYRFADLVRMANHKNASGYNGTQWLATKIANREVGTDSDGNTTNQPNTEIYNKLLDTTNWYFTKPAW